MRQIPQRPHTELEESNGKQRIAGMAALLKGRLAWAA
jgi:hypothetical protein